MTAKHIVLRSQRSPSRNTFLGGGFPAISASFSALTVPDTTVQVEEFDARDIPLLTREADVVAVAPAMPMRLILPSEVPAGAAGTNAAWGVGAVRADASPYSGEGVVVAVLDTGIDPMHPAFAGVDLIRRNFTSEAPDDLDGHGTHCAGTIFGRDVNGVRIGVARGVTRAVIGKVLGQGMGSSDQVAEAIHWAVEAGAHVISMSLGFDFPGWAAQLQNRGVPPELAVSRALEDYRANVRLFETLAAYIRAREAWGQATLMVAAAGNESRRDQNPDWTIGVAPPAVAEGFLSVAALAQGGDGLQVAPFSNHGANVAGPGVAVLSARIGGGLKALSGTSMATPHVAGVAALWAQKLRQTRPLTTSKWSVDLVGSSTTAGFSPSVRPSDMDAGIVQAPL